MICYDGLVEQASCTMCQGVTPVPYAPGRIQFRCERCGKGVHRAQVALRLERRAALSAQCPSASNLVCCVHRLPATCACIRAAERLLTCVTNTLLQAEEARRAHASGGGGGGSGFGEFAGSLGATCDLSICLARRGEASVPSSLDAPCRLSQLGYHPARQTSIWRRRLLRPLRHAAPVRHSVTRVSVVEQGAVAAGRRGARDGGGG
jgi:hypothetical protein